MNGAGTYIWPTQRRFDGSWVDNLIDGQGKLTENSGKMFEVHFRDNVEL